MRKLNISGLVNKCKELWKNIVEIKDILEEELSSLEEDTTEEFQSEDLVGIEPGIMDNDDVEMDKKPSETIVIKTDISLDDLKALFDEYIGVSITGFLSYTDAVPDLETKIGPRKGIINLLSDVEIEGDHLWLKLSIYDGRHGGYLKISPSVGCHFIEKEDGEDPDKFAKYRLKFMGGDCIEYIDHDNKGEISYFAGYR
jgi:hypothetical protein